MKLQIKQETKQQVGNTNSTPWRKISFNPNCSNQACPQEFRKLSIIVKTDTGPWVKTRLGKDGKDSEEDSFDNDEDDKDVETNALATLGETGALQ